MDYTLRKALPLRGGGDPWREIRNKKITAIMIKKLILLLLVVCGGVVSANADEPDIYMRSNIYSTSDNVYYGWDNDVDDLKFTCQGTDPTNSNQVIYTKTIDATNISSDINFRLHISTWGNTQLVPYQGRETIWTFPESNFISYDINSWSDDFKSDYWNGSSNPYKDSYFSIQHTVIKASKYKITLYRVINNNAGNEGHIYMVVDIISMPAKIGPFGYTTFSCNRALDLSTMTNAYYVASNPTESVKLVQTTGTVPAGEGLVLYGEPNAEINIPVAETTSANAISGNLLKGCPKDASLTKDTPGYENVYVLVNMDTQAEFQNVKAWLDENNTLTIPAGKAYLQATGSGAPSFSIELGDETTGIMETVRETTTNNQYYTLDGRRVAQPTKGLYIVNGKKVIIK